MKKYGIFGIILLISYGSYGMEEKLSLAQLVFKAHLTEESKNNIEWAKSQIQVDSPEITVKATFFKSILKDDSHQLPASQQLLYNAVITHFTENPAPIPCTVQLTPEVNCTVCPFADCNNAYVFQATCKKDEIRHLIPIS